MRILTLILLAGIAFICGCAQSRHAPPRVVELPSPNSGVFSFEQAEAKKDLILSNLPSKPLTNWKNPYLGFAIHVTAQDTFKVYSVRGSLTVTVGIERIDPKKTFTVEGIQELEHSIIRFGSPDGILITSERPLHESKAFPALLKALFVPGTQLYYLAPE